jgi:hypothetical protein
MGTVRTVGPLALCALALAFTAGCHDADPLAPDASDGSVGMCDGAGTFPVCGEHFPLDGPPPWMCLPWATAPANGCATGERCIWHFELIAQERTGMFACVPDGSLGFGDACTEASEVADDQCGAGLVCLEGTCHESCGFDGSADAACPANFNCMRFDGIYANGDDRPSAGICLLGCDPVAQLQADGTPCGAGEGCYLLTSQTETVAVCAAAGTIAPGQLITGTAFANSCVPGAQPRRRDQATAQVECGGLCRPADVTSTTHVADEGGVAPHDCQDRWGAAPPTDATAGESCRYWWAREPFDLLSPYSNTVGWCFKHAIVQYDTDGDMVVDAPFPRCTTLTTGDVVPPIGNPPHNDAQFFWCTALPASALFGGARSLAEPAPQLRLDRLQP